MLKHPKMKQKDNLKIKYWIILLLLLLFITLILVSAIIFGNYFDIHNQKNLHLHVDKEIITKYNSDEKAYSNIQIQTLEDIKRILNDVQINTWTANDQLYPKVSSLSDGNFIVIWQSYLQNDSGWDIYAQMFYSNGIKKENEFRVNNYTISNTTNPNIAALSGKFMVV